MKYHYKKLLLVSHYAPPVSYGAGLLMYHLMSRLPFSYVILTGSREEENGQYKKYQLDDAVYYFYSTNNINPAVHGGENIAKTSKVSFIKKLFQLARRATILRRLGQCVVIIRHIQNIVREGSIAIEKERPDMIIGYSDGGQNLIASYVLSLKYRLPLSLFFYDLYKGNNFTPVLEFYSKIFEPLLLRRAHHIFVTNDLLKEIYQKRAGKNIVTTIYNSLPEGKHLTGSIDKNERKTIAYLGSVYWPQESALLDLIKAAQLLDEKPQIVLYTPYTVEYLNVIGIYESDDVIFTTCTPENAILEMEKHTLTFLGMSHNTAYPELINTSSPTRLCDYLYANVPMLVHAPADSFVVMHAKKYDFAYISTIAGPEQLAKVLREALTGLDREEKIKNAHRVAKELHNPENSAQLFLTTIQS